ncbi:MAG: LapA family protein [Acidimicrobiales bacterium]|nr:LapA family protein [Acidimicrobiales bacterium]
MSEETVSEESSESTGLATVVSAAVVAIALIAFIVQNRSDTEVSWLFIDGTWPLWVVIVIAAVAGAVLSEVVGWMLRRRRRNKG